MVGHQNIIAEHNIYYVSFEQCILHNMDCIALHRVFEMILLLVLAAIFFTAIFIFHFFCFSSLFMRL